MEVAASVRVVLPLPGAGRGFAENVALIPLGSPLAANVTAELKPVAPATVKVIGTEPPRARLVVVALGVSVKLARMVSVRF